MSFVGAGFQKAGFSPAGIGSPSPAAVNQTVPLPDPLTGLGQTCRLINYQTGDYSFTADGRVQGMSSVQQLVLLALMDSNLFRGIEDKGNGFQRKLAAAVQNQLASFIRQGWVQLMSVDFANASAGSPDAAGVLVRWRDLTIPNLSANGTTAQNTFTITIPTA
jgi:hypothetical protein